MIRAILAHDAFWGIGKNGKLPWKNTRDLEWFKECTEGGAVVMGRKTWDSLPRKPLPGRENIVISNSDVQGADSVMNLSAALEKLPKINFDKDVWVIGGASVLEQLLPIIDELWLNNVDGDYNCDIFLPKMQITRDFEPSHTRIERFGIITHWTRRT
jgi:dihydrofolate reductase